MSADIPEEDERSTKPTEDKLQLSLVETMPPVASCQLAMGF